MNATSIKRSLASLLRARSSETVGLSGSQTSNAFHRRLPKCYAQDRGTVIRARSRHQVRSDLKSATRPMWLVPGRRIATEQAGLNLSQAQERFFCAPVAKDGSYHHPIGYVFAREGSESRAFNAVTIVTAILLRK